MGQFIQLDAIENIWTVFEKGLFYESWRVILRLVCEPLWESKKTQKPVFCFLLIYSQYFLSDSVFGTEAALVQATNCCHPSLVCLVCQVRNALGTWIKSGEKNDFGWRCEVRLHLPYLGLWQEAS